MAKGTNLKVNMTADNSDLKKKARESQTAIRDFEKVGSDAVSKLGEAFGVNTGKIEQMASALRGLGTKLSESTNAGTAAFGKLAASVGGLGTAIAGIGIGTIVAGFKMLNAEAENFKTTIAGANLEMATAAYINTYKQVIHDFNNEVGEGFANAESGWKKFWGKTGATFRAGLSTGAAFSATPGDFNNQAIQSYNDLLTEAGQKAETADTLTRNILDKMDEISTMSVEWARMEREIAEYKRIAYDKTASTAEQQKAIAKAEELIVKRYQEEADARSQIATWTVQLNAQAESSREALHQENELRIRAESVTASMNNALRELSERQASIATQAQKEADARAQALASAQAMAQARADMKAVDLSLSSGNSLKDELPSLLETPDGGLAIPVKPVLQTDDIIDISQELQSALTSVFETIGTSLGSLIGDLLTGGDAWGNFADSAIAAFGDMAMSVGKMAVSIGVAALAIQGALTSLNGWAAIAAGTALIALGAAVKTGLSNIASGGYSSSASVATSGNYGSKNVAAAFDSRELNVKVSGHLYASGNQLMAVIENENNRKNHTT